MLLFILWHTLLRKTNTYFNSDKKFDLNAVRYVGVRISSTFSVLRPFSNLRPFLYFDHFPIFDLFCTSTHRLYFHLNFFDFWEKIRFLRKLSIFEQTFDFWAKFRYLSKILIFRQNFDFWAKFRFLRKLSIFKKLRGQRREVEVERSKRSRIGKWSKYRKGRTNAYPRYWQWKNFLRISQITLKYD